jgi:hypothetical protein
MLRSISSLVAAMALLLAGAPGGVRAQGVPFEPSEPLVSISGQVVDRPDDYYVVRSDGGRTRIRFRGWPEELPGDRSVLGIGDNVRATGWLGEDTLAVGGILDVVGVYVEDRRAYFALGEFADGAVPFLPPIGGIGPVDGRTSLTGVIGEIGTGELVLRAGELRIPVATSSLRYNPFDDVGSQRLRPGDTVTVEGTLDRSSEDGPRLRADRITSIFVVGAAG